MRVDQVEDAALRGRAVRLIVGRVAFVLLLLLANLWRTRSFADLAGGENSDGLFVVFSLTVGLSFVYFAALKFAPNTIDQIRIQFAVDLCVTTWLVWQTGDIISPYVTLYIVLISVAGFFLGKTETLILAIACAAAFTGLSILSAYDLVFSEAGDQPPSRILQIVGVNNVAILLVGLLAARLSERRRLSEELKYSEESFADLHLLHERIVESISSGLITTDLAGRIYAFNRRAEEITGLRAADAIGKSIFDLFGEEIKTRVEQALCRSPHEVRAPIDPEPPGETGPLYFETGFQNGDGPPRVTAACTIVPLTGRSGATNGLIVTFQDVTQVRALEETVRRSDRLAAVGRMAAGLAHEIRNPLGSMSSALQFLQERSSGANEESALMGVVLRESERMNSIITNFLAFARPSSATGGSPRSLMDVTAALEDCLSLIRHSPEVKTAHTFKFDVDSGVTVEADETQIKQVFWNLARNAIQSMPDGGQLSVSLKRAEGGRVLVEFRDTGIGMSEEILEHAFEPFTSASGGTGLGLSIVYKIVQDHGGHIAVDSRPGEGTGVAVVLPESINAKSAHS